MHLFSKASLPLAALALWGLAAAVPAHAQIGVFNFNSDAVGKTTAFSDANGGITATFSSPSDPGAFAIFANPAPSSVLLSGNVLGNGAGAATGSATPLTVAFSQNLASLTLDFVDASAFLANPQTFTLQAFENGTSVGTVTVPGVRPPAAPNAEGVIGFFGPAFNSVQLSSASTTLFSIDNLTAIAAPVPEASTTVSLGLLLALGMGGVVRAARKNRNRR